MRRVLLVALTWIGLTSSAWAIDIPGCGEFLLYMQGSPNVTIDALFENGPTTLTGNVLLLSGRLNLGSNNVIHGSVTAPVLFVGTGASIDVCNTNALSGPGTCGVVNPFAPPAACVFPPLPVPNFPALCLPGTNVTVAVNGALAPGCYGSLRVNKGIELTLQAGGNYAFAGEFRVISGGTVKSSTLLAPADVLVRGFIVTEAGVVLQDLNLTTLSGPLNNVHFFNSNILRDVVVFSPVGEIHAHTGTQLQGTSELVSRAAVIEPISNVPPPNNVFCTCPAPLRLGGPAQICIP